jgi:hypothetical protein
MTNKTESIMKKIKSITSLIILFLSLAGASKAQQTLNSNASYIKNKFPDSYHNTIRQFAVNKWDDDYRMIIYTINNQADALFKVVNKFKSDNTGILFSGIKKWSLKGYKSSNITKFKKLKSVSVSNMIEFHCDWRMVKYYYDNQSEAKNAF